MSDAFPYRHVFHNPWSGGFQGRFTPTRGRGKGFCQRSKPAYNRADWPDQLFAEGDLCPKRAALSLFAACLALCAAGVHMLCEGIPQPLPPDGEIPLARSMILLIEICTVVCCWLYPPTNLDTAGPIMLALCLRHARYNLSDRCTAIADASNSVHWQHAQRNAVPVQRACHTKERGCIASGRHAPYVCCKCTLFAVVVTAAAVLLTQSHCRQPCDLVCCLLTLLVSLSFMFIP